MKYEHAPLARKTSDGIPLHYPKLKHLLSEGVYEGDDTVEEILRMLIKMHAALDEFYNPDCEYYGNNGLVRERLEEVLMRKDREGLK